MEIDPHYVDVAVRRWQTLTGESACHAATGRSFAKVEFERDAEADKSAEEVSDVE